MTKPSERALKKAREIVTDSLKQWSKWTKLEKVDQFHLTKILEEDLAAALDAEAAPKKLSEDELDKRFDAEFSKIPLNELPSHYPHWTSFLKMYKAGYRLAHGEEV